MNEGEQSKKVLLIEDDKFMSIVYCNGLRAAGFDASSFGTRDEALAAARAGKPDLIVLDIILSDENGFDILPELKKDAVLKDVPVWIFSNLKEPEDIEKGKRLGADRYILKTEHTRKDFIENVREYFSSL